ncbi:MAG: epoxide hydrolase, partial [Pseudomonadota bacterium]
MSAEPTPFTLHVPDEDIADLKERLARARFLERTPGDPWAYGSSVDYMAGLTTHWRDRFDWRVHEALLNSFPQFKVPLHDIDVHFLHVEGKGPNPMPLLLMHGWPGSVFEFLEIIPRLTDPERFGGRAEDAFTVVAPSLPGFGLSFAPGQRRFSIEEIADCLADLMTEVLGYERFAAQGGDWGSFAATRMAYVRPERLIGIHLNLLPLTRNPKAAASPTEAEKVYYNELREFLREETGYQWIQGTRPDTLALALHDSPMGLASWIVEKFWRWSDCDGDLANAFDRDRILANISLYWVTGAIASSFWPYYARLHGDWPIPVGETV